LFCAGVLFVACNVGLASDIVLPQALITNTTATEAKEKRSAPTMT
jgi:hypothetical protein